MRFGRPDSIALAEMENLRSLPKLNDSPREVCAFACKVQNSVAVLRALGKTHYLYNPEIVYRITEKLTPALRYRWYDFAFEHSEDEPDLLMFSRYIEKEAMKCARFAAPEPIYTDDFKQHRQHTHRVFHLEEKKKPYSVKIGSCPICREQHVIVNCKKMKKTDSKGRWDLAKQHRLCYRCLRDWSKGHKCPGKPCRIRGCEKTHHPLLHHDLAPAKTETATVTHLRIAEHRQKGQTEHNSSQKKTLGPTYRREAPKKTEVQSEDLRYNRITNTEHRQDSNSPHLSSSPQQHRLQKIENWRKHTSEPAGGTATQYFNGYLRHHFLNQYADRQHRTEKDDTGESHNFRQDREKIIDSKSPLQKTEHTAEHGSTERKQSSC
ncbi:hypothetical protein ABMA27_008899 [Loxostege sticticalis]|uniref:Uncharacterized protein n=1 Tax=Loxostege sticticalis TaxID=481309 RepID=A0ABR3H9G0_LOXSC